MLVVVAIMLLPVLYMLTMSLRTPTDIAQAPLGLPLDPAWENYARALPAMNYAQAILNSVIITVAVAALTALLGSMAAFPIVMRAGWWTRIMIMVVALGMATPNFVVITPIYVIFRDLGLLNTYPGIILAYAALNLPLAIFFYIGFMSTIPRELLESARLDRCNDWQVFWRIVRPLLGPATATLSLFVMLFVWNDLTYPLLLLTDPAKQTVTISVYRFVGNQNVLPDQLFPAAVLGSLPLLVLFLIFQRRIVAGVTAGAGK
ncbi:sugar ABC transporter permease [Agromyces rhizosphaerae]|uniref:Sugar ABC transporter permease n=1 Tax=Agromyces rhizosphaerae TaxID=88374 RepID=A0A9W6CUG7_9MICO|nr:sugar ABC transporter permease [Agromyces rhizosphaerae]